MKIIELSRSGGDILAISKLILNGEVQMDVTSDTVAAGSLLSGKTATKNDGTKVTGTIASKSSSDLTVSGATVTAPAGYYANAASKAVTTTTHPNPTAAITSSTGVVTASHTQGTGYVTGGTTTGTLNLTTQAGKTVTPTETAQTAVASYRWTTGPVSVAAISSTYVGTGVTTRSSADLTASGSVVTAPAGYYSTAATKSIGAGSAFPPAVTITKAPTIGVNTSGVVTASYNGSSSITPTVTSGYVSQGTAGTISTTGTSTYQLTSKAAATYYPSTADQTIASQRWLVGNQTIKSVTTSNLTAANIAEGVVVKVGDSANASRITQITGTHSGGATYTVTITSSGSGSTSYVKYKNIIYRGGDTIFVSRGDTIQIYVTTGDSNYLYIDDVQTTGGWGAINGYEYTVTFDTEINFQLSVDTSYAYITIPSINIIENGKYEVGEYGYANVDVDLPFYNIYQTLATGISISASMENMSEFCNSYSIINRALFLNKEFIGSFIFENVTTIYAAAFASLSNIGGIINATSFSFPEATQIGTYAFIDNKALKYISIPKVQSIDAGAFSSCRYLTEVYAPETTFIGSSAFYSCSSLVNINFSKVTSIEGYAFYNCTSLLNFYASSLSHIGSSAFNGCNKLQNVDFTMVNDIGSYALANCTSLTSINLPLCTTLELGAFLYCIQLSMVSLPICSVVRSSAFGRCSSLTTISLPACTLLGGEAFKSCYNLLSVYLLGSSIVSLQSWTIFNSTPISNYTASTGGVYGSIFVPSSLYNSYRTATNWSVYSARIVSI